jgi:hypothetical protein
MHVKADFSVYVSFSISISISIVYPAYAFERVSLYNIRNRYSITATNFSFKMRTSLIGSLNKSGKAWVRHVARIGEKNAYRIFVGKTEGKKQITRPRRRC